MQSDLPEVSRTTSVPEPTPKHHSPSKHGLQHPDHPVSPGSHSRGLADDAQLLHGEQHDSALPATLYSGDVDDAQKETRLKTASPILSSLSLDYEPISPTSQKNAFPLAKKTSKKSGPHGTTISTLPNEILTHAISHLAPTDLSSVALVSRRFHGLVTTPHAWRAAFARFFPGPASLATVTSTVAEGKGETFRSDKRAFCRLTALATWRSEYILRTRLLRSLSRGKPMQASSSSSTPRGTSSPANAIMMYNSQLYTTVNYLDAAFGSGPLKRFPRFVHAADENGIASASDPITGKVDNWGLSDPQFFPQFADQFPGDAMWGLGAGEITGLPNMMSVSQAHGMVHGEGVPAGGVYFRSVDEMRGRFLAGSLGLSDLELGIPAVDRTVEAISAVWLAKSASIPSLTEGLIGILSGSSLGIVSAYSLGSNDLRDLRLARGELTARWVLSPGVPIIAIAVDEPYSLKRQAQNRIWAVALNALGELFYLTKFPKRSAVPRGSKLDEPAVERLAWGTGRTVLWNLVEPSRRVARPDPYGDLDVEGSYSPRSSWNGMCLSKEQIRAECREIEKFLRKLPKDFRRLCNGWDMRRRLEVDFAGDDGNFAGESLTVIECGLDEDSTVAMQRFLRLKVAEKETNVAEEDFSSIPDEKTPVMERNSIFGSSSLPAQHSPPTDQLRGRKYASMSYSSLENSPERTPTVEEWRCSQYLFGGSKHVQITATTIDCSTYATLTLSEDPAVGMLGSSEASSAYGSPQHIDDRPINPSDIPGQRSRFIAAGTKTGTIYVWDCRAPSAKTVDLVNVIDPIRIIYTDSPEISCLAMTALQLVHGGNDGLVQVWDPLASSSEPIRTLNSRFSSKARRRLVQAQASAQGVGINLFAAGVICLDPDPTMLRGVVSLGTHIRYWSYSSFTADHYKGTKRRLRRSPRGSNNHGGERFTATVRNSNLKVYIANERHELEREKEHQRRESERLAGRFGLGLLGSEEEALAYAALLSEESLALDEQRRASQTTTPVLPYSNSFSQEVAPNHEILDPDIAEAIRLSLEGDRIDVLQDDSPDYSYLSSPASGSYDVPIRIARKGRRSPKSASRSPPLKTVAESSVQQEMSDLDFALQLSLAEAQSRTDSGQEDFPALSGSGTPSKKGKGKGKGRE